MEVTEWQHGKANAVPQRATGRRTRAPQKAEAGALVSQDRGELLVLGQSGWCQGALGYRADWPLVVWCWPWVIRAQEYCLLECKNQREEAAESWGSRLVGFHMKSMLRGGPLVVSENWPDQEEQCLPSQRGPQVTSLSAAWAFVCAGLSAEPLWQSCRSRTALQSREAPWPKTAPRWRVRTSVMMESTGGV